MQDESAGAGCPDADATTACTAMPVLQCPQPLGCVFVGEAPEKFHCVDARAVMAVAAAWQRSTQVTSCSARDLLVAATLHTGIPVPASGRLGIAGRVFFAE